MICMADYVVRFNDAPEPVRVPHGTLVIEAARLARVSLPQHCRKGTCGRCNVLIVEGRVHRRGARRMMEDDPDADFVPACQAEIESDAFITVMK